jgi:hypothetical protein
MNKFVSAVLRIAVIVLGTAPVDVSAQWLPGEPGAASGADAVAPGTSPTSWYTTPENVQHIAYVDTTDQLIHELFYFIGRPNAQWLHGVPGAVSDVRARVAVAPGTSPTSWYTTPENVQHIAYVGETDQLIHELFYFIGRPNPQWLPGVPGAVSDVRARVAVAPGTSPTSWYTTPENVQHIAYVGTDQKIHELFFVIGGDGVWRPNVPGDADGAPSVASGTSPTSWYTTPENVQHIAYVGTDQKIHELFFVIGGDGVWRHNVPGDAGGTPSVASGTSPTSWYTTPENVQHIAYVGTDYRIHELFYLIGRPNAQWLPGAVSDVAVAPGNFPPPVRRVDITSPTSWYTTPENVQHIAYVGTDYRIHELFYFIGRPNAQWLPGEPGAASPVPVAQGTSPTSWYTTPENVQHIAYVGTDQRIHELFFFVVPPPPPYPDSNGIVVESVNNFGGVGDLQNSNMVFPGSPFHRSLRWIDPQVNDTDFVDPALNPLGIDSGNFDLPGTAISYLTAHGSTADGCTSVTCTTTAACPEFRDFTHPPVPRTCRYSPMDPARCCNMVDRLAIVNGSGDRFGGSINYTSGPIRWGNSPATGGWAGAGTSGGTNVVVLDISHGVLPPFWRETFQNAAAGVQLILTMMTAGGDTAIVADRGSTFAAFFRANPNMSVAQAWKDTMNSLPFNEGATCPTGGGGHGFNGCGCNVALGFDNTLDRAKAALGESWIDITHANNVGLGNQALWVEWQCNYPLEATDQSAWEKP